VVDGVLYLSVRLSVGGQGAAGRVLPTRTMMELNGMD